AGEAPAGNRRPPFPLHPERRPPARAGGLARRPPHARGALEDALRCLRSRAVRRRGRIRRRSARLRSVWRPIASARGLVRRGAVRHGPDLRGAERVRSVRHRRQLGSGVSGCGIRLASAAQPEFTRPGPGGRLAILGLGKVAAELYEGVRDGGEALLVVPKDAPAPARATVLRGSHPLPDADSLASGEALLAAAGALGRHDAALLLISGGGSALAEAPHADLSLEDVRAVNEALLNSGAPIEEMNCV